MIPALFPPVIMCAQWLGVRPSDLDRYNLPEQCRLDMEPHDIRKGEQLLKEDFVQKNPEWVKVQPTLYIHGSFLPARVGLTCAVLWWCRSWS